MHVHVAPVFLRRLSSFVLLSWLSAASAHAGAPDPLRGEGMPRSTPRSIVSGGSGQIVPLDTLDVPCPLLINFAKVPSGDYPGTNYDGIVISGDVQFSEHFAGQSVGSNGVFDVVSGTPTDPLQSEAGAAGQNLDLFDDATKVLAGLGAIGYPDIDAIGEGSIAIYYPAAQSRVKLSIVGGNGGSARVRFYRQNGSLIDEVVVSGLTDLSYGFGTFDDSHIIAGILIQNDDASGIGVANVCYDGFKVSTRPLTWGRLKQLYR